VTKPLLHVPVALRLAVLGLAMFSALARPMYSTWCETHQLGHELSALGHEPFRPDSTMERELDAEHARGAHGSLHSDDGGVYADTAAVVTVPVVQIFSVMNPQEIVLPDPVQRIGRLFRPPIA
jgi:hypothetical protein